MEVEKEGPTAGKIMGELVVIEHIEDINNVSISTLVLKNMTNLHLHVMISVSMHTKFRSCNSAEEMKF